MLTFGKHNGKRLEEVPLDYLVWLQDYDKHPEGIVRDGVDWSVAAQQEIIRRKHEGYTQDLFGNEIKENRSSKI